MALAVLLNLFEAVLLKVPDLGSAGAILCLSLLPVSRLFPTRY